MTDLAQRIKKRMADLGINQYDLARMVGISQVSVQKVLAGETKKPRDILLYAKALGVTVDYLQNGQEMESKDLPPVIERKEWETLSPTVRNFVDELLRDVNAKVVNDEVVIALQNTIGLLKKYGNNNNNHAHA